jgi:PAS domain S-box-containing protein
MLRRAHDELESRVQARTEELRLANLRLQSENEERKRVEAALRFAQYSVDSTSDALFWLTRDARFFYVNDAACRSLGYAREELLSMTAPDIVPNFQMERWPAHWEELKTTGSASYESLHRRKDGTSFPVEINVDFLEFEGVEYQFVSARDMTTRKRLEEQLRQAHKMEAIGNLAGGVAHDFNNLLAVILGHSELLEERLENDDRSSTQAMIQAATRGAELTQRLLAFSRRQPLQPDIVDLGGLVDGITGLLSRTLGATIEVETVSAPDLWRTLADAGQVENALLNLAINARDAMLGGGRLTIESANVTLDEDYAARQQVRPGDYVTLAVSDTGDGIAPDVLPHVFDPFFTTKDVGKGSGLGLSMVYGFAQQSGGHVTIYSEPGHGTTVKIYLPRTEEGAAASAFNAAAAAPEARGETVLVVEDDKDVRDLAAAYLRSLGYVVIEAADAEAALVALAEASRVELLLSDVMLPGGMSGPDLAAEVKRRRPETKVLFMSGYPDNAMASHNLLDDAADLLNKPFQRRDLAAKLRAVLDEQPAPTHEARQPSAAGIDPMPETPSSEHSDFPPGCGHHGERIA